MIAQSKPYYPAPIYPLLVAAGAVWLEKSSWGGFGSAPGIRRHWPYLLLVFNLATVPFLLPVLPTSTYVRLHDGFPNPEFAEMFGWPELVETVGTAFQELPEEIRGNTKILASNYGVASALDLFGSAYELPPTLCFQNSYYYWTTPVSIDSVILIGFGRDTVERYFGTVEDLGVISNEYGIINQEAGRSFFFLASDPKVAPQELRAAFKYFG